MNQSQFSYSLHVNPFVQSSKKCQSSGKVQRVQRVSSNTKNRSLSLCLLLMWQGQHQQQQQCQCQIYPCQQSQLCGPTPSAPTVEPDTLPSAALPFVLPPLLRWPFSFRHLITLQIVAKLIYKKQILGKYKHASNSLFSTM